MVTHLCIDIGGTNTLIGVGEVFDCVSTVDTDTFLNDIHGTLDRVIHDAGYSPDDVTETAVAVAGPLDMNSGEFFPPNIAVESVQIVEPLKSYGKTLHVMNDCDAAALGEYTFGNHGSENLVYVTISTGIGAGVILNGEVLNSKNGVFSEVGHMIVGNQGLPCGCGGTDHWESYCSGSRLPLMAKTQYGASYKDSRDLLNSAKNGDDIAQQVVADMQQYNAQAFATITNMYIPDTIVLGGGVALNHPDLILNGLEDLIAQHAIAGTPNLRLSRLREHAVLHGLKAKCSPISPIRADKN